MVKKIPLSVRLDDDTLQLLEQRVKELGRPRAWVMAQAIRLFVEQDKNEWPPAPAQETQIYWSAQASQEFGILRGRGIQQQKFLGLVAKAAADPDSGELGPSSTRIMQDEQRRIVYRIVRRIEIAKILEKQGG